MPKRSDKTHIPEGLTSSARKEFLRYLRACEQQQARVRQVSLTIVIWGPTQHSNESVARKRKQICDELRKLGHNALFPEEISSLQPHPGSSQCTKEFDQLLLADLAIALIEDSPGALAEVHDFASHPELAPKIFVMVPVRYRQSYSANGVLRELEDAHGGVYWYEESEIASCEVLGRALRRAEARRQHEYRFRQARIGER